MRQSVKQLFDIRLVDDLLLGNLTGGRSWRSHPVLGRCDDCDVAHQQRVERIFPINRGIFMRQTGQVGHWVLRASAKVLMVGLSASLVGCGNSDIDAVKKQALDQDQSYTVEQAFDNRKVCDSVKWDEITDNRGRKIVEYRCFFNGVDDYVNTAETKATDKINWVAQTAKHDYNPAIFGDKDKFFAKVDADQAAELQRIADYRPTSVAELFQWSMSENGDPVLIFAGSDVKYKNGKEKLGNYYDVGTQHAIQAMIRNDTATYAQYVAETNLGG
jgi:hypothetical protein